MKCGFNVGDRATLKPTRRDSVALHLCLGNVASPFLVAICVASTLKFHCKSIWLVLTTFSPPCPHNDLDGICVCLCLPRGICCPELASPARILRSEFADSLEVLHRTFVDQQISRSSKKIYFSTRFFVPVARKCAQPNQIVLGSRFNHVYRRIG